MPLRAIAVAAAPPGTVTRSINTAVAVKGATSASCGTFCLLKMEMGVALLGIALHHA